MSEKLRLFVAAVLPEAHLGRVAEAVAPHRARLSRARWADPANQHVTLKFLGWTPADRFDEIGAAARAAVATLNPAEVWLAGFGAFPSRTRMRVLWVGLEDPDGVLATCAAALDGALAALGFEAEKRPFHAHLTVARFKVPERFPEDLPESAFDDLAPVRVDEVVLFRSHLSPRGARYEALASLPIRGPERGQ